MERLKKNLIQNKGFSIVEIVVAMALLAILVAGFGGLLTGSFSGIYSAGFKSGSQYVAQDVMENVIAGTATGGTGINIDSDPVSDFLIEFGSYSVLMSGEEVNVSIDYIDGYGNNRTTTYTSFLP